MKMTVHRALALKKSTNERIKKRMADNCFIEMTKGKSGKVNGVPVSEVEGNIRGGYDSLEGLIGNYDKICRSIAESNAKTIVSVNGDEMTVSQLLTRLQDDGWLASKERLLEVMRKAHGAAVKKIEKENEIVNEKFEDLLKVMAGGDKKTLSASELSQQTAMYHESNDMRLVDPLGLADKIKALEKMIEDFKAESDAVLSESNAVTFIEVDLTE